MCSAGTTWMRIGTRVLKTSREDIAFATLGYKNDVVGNIHVSWADPNKVREVVAVGSRRRVVFNDLNDVERVRVFERGVSAGEAVTDSYGEFKLLVRDGDIISPKVEPSEPLKNQCRASCRSRCSRSSPRRRSTTSPPPSSIPRADA
jgi:predicted dehydrogenase